MANKVVAIALLAVAISVVLLAEAPAMTEAVTCSPVQLASCAPAIFYNQAPSQGCCNKLVEQKPCLCGYKKNPSLSQYINSPGARRVESTCGVSVTC